MAEACRANEDKRCLPSGTLPAAEIPEDDAERFAGLLKNVAEELVRLLKSGSLYLVLAESCTAGLAADALARVPGASSCLWGSFVCYTFRAKMRMLGLGEEQLNKYGLVSEETARAMALGALEKSGADAAVSITGLAGPDGDGSGIPVGTVWIATALRDPDGPDSAGVSCGVAGFHFEGGRNRVRRQAARQALEQITIQLKKAV